MRWANLAQGEKKERETGGEKNEISEKNERKKDEENDLKATLCYASVPFIRVRFD